MLPKPPDASSQDQMQDVVKPYSFAQNTRRRKGPAFPDYSGWTLKPEFREDLGERADFMESMLRVFGPSMPGGLGKMFYRFMSPPAGAAPPQGNSFASLMSGRGSMSGQRGGGMSLAANSMLNRRF